MAVWNRNALIFQIAIMLVVGVVYFLGYQNAPALWLFTFAEFVALEAQRHENKDAVFYRKSCLFAFADLFSVIYFLAVLALETWALFHSHAAVPGLRFEKWLFLYIAARKLYILKNYTYEK